MRYDNRSQRRYGSGITPDTTDAVFTGQVESVGPEPQFISGRVPAVQTLAMTVTDVRRGDAVSVGDTVDVDVMIVRGNPHMGVGDSGLPALDAAMVQPGALVVAWANQYDGRWQALEISTDGPQINFGGRARRR